jgi:N-acetyl-anhydromuramyl-L-alanine amidase AmpD
MPDNQTPGEIAGEAATAPQPLISKIPLKENQYYQGIYTKKYIILHHTAGGSAASSIGGWAATPEHIATPYVIDRDGTIYECYDPKYWAYSLGVKGATFLEKAAIPIEIANYGALDKTGKTYTGKIIAPEKTVKVDFRGQSNWEAYTPQQILSLKWLLPFLIKQFGITPQADRSKFWEYQDPFKLPMGIYSHTTVRKDKIDIFPQKEIIELVQSL